MQVVSACAMASVAFALACRAATPPPIDPPKVQPEPPVVVFGAYDAGKIRITGAPPLDATLVKAHDQFGWTSAVRLLDVDGDAALIGRGGACAMLGLSSPPDPGPFGTRCDPARWARLAFSDTTYGRRNALSITEAAHEWGVIERFDGRAVSPPGRIGEVILDHVRGRLVYGIATADGSALWMTTDPARFMPTVPASDQEMRKIADGAWSPVDVSRDGRTVLARRELATARVGLYTIDLATGHAIALTDPETSTTRARFTAGGDVLAISDATRDRRGLVRIDPWGATWLTDAAMDEVSEFVELPAGIAFVTTIDGVSTLRFRERDGGTHAVPGAPDDGVIADLHAAGAALVFTFTSPARGRAVFHWQPGGPPIRLWPRDAAAGPEPTFHEVTADDGVRSQLLVYTPAKTERPPVIVDLHGGPEDRWLPAYDAAVHWLVAQGYAVVRPNVRGSTGQGRAFAALDDGERRDHVLRDLRATLDWIAAQPDLDASRVVVMGTSYGGYLALRALQEFPERLRGGITLGAITDLPGFLEGTAAYRRDHRRAEYGDERDPATRARLDRQSPIRSIDKLAGRPLLIAHGARDPRVPFATSEAFVRAARAAGVPVWSMVAADEGHWFERAENHKTFEVLAVQFLRQHVR